MHPAATFGQQTFGNNIIVNIGEVKSKLCRRWKYFIIAAAGGNFFCSSTTKNLAQHNVAKRIPSRYDCSSAMQWLS
jgi:hypothetical protein